MNTEEYPYRDEKGRPYRIERKEIHGDEAEVKIYPPEPSPECTDSVKNGNFFSSSSVQFEITEEELV